MIYLNKDGLAIFSKTALWLFTNMTYCLLGVRSYSGQIIPRNIAEINDSHIGMASIDR